MKLIDIDSSIKVKETIGIVSHISNSTMDMDSTMFREVLIQLEEDDMAIVEVKFMNLLWNGIWFIGTEIDKVKGII
ncbi:MAG: hypothetical protein WC554_18745 [Clostridia bacterium]|jgi:hypothetical protein